MKNFQKWNMDILFKDSFFIEKIQRNSSGLEILLEEHSEYKTKIKFLFEDTVYSYTVIDEGCKPSVWISERKSTILFIIAIVRKKLKNVEYIRDDILHFLMIGIDDVIDVFISVFPSIEKMD